MRARLAPLASATAIALLASGCTLLGVGPYGSSTPSVTTAQTTDQQTTAPSSSNPSSASATSSSSSASTDPNDVPVASYDKSAHEMWPDAPKAPDRLKLQSTAKPGGFADAPEGKGMDRYLNQKIRWEKCGDFTCGTVLVPLDWDDPDGQAITLKMKRRAASGTKKGTMFINPGGPGGSGQEYVEGFDAAGFPDHDIIGWDTRGAGESTPVVCASDEQMNQYNAVDLSPDDDQEFSALLQANKQFSQWCREKSGPLLDHISTIDTVRDLDYLRHLVGDKQLTYMGVSYGTFIGAVYTELYPKRAGRMVLDSAVNITDKDSVIQAMGFDLALKEFAGWCAEQGADKCPYGSTGEEVTKNLVAWFDELDQKPIKGLTGKNLDQNDGVLGVAAFLYSGKEAYETLLNSIVFARKLREPRFLVLAAGFLKGQDESGHYTPMAFSFPAIACADSPDDGEKELKPDWQKAEKMAPIFGKFMGPGIQCTYWSARPMDPLKLVGKGSPPVLVLGATGDPATPYEQSQWMAQQLEGGVMVTWKGAGHGVYSLGNSCAKKAVEGFVNDGTVPKDGTTC